MGNELQRHKKEEEQSKEIFKEVDRSGEKFIKAEKEITAAEEHVGRAISEEIGVDRSLAETEKNVQDTEKEIIRVQREIKGRKESGAEKAYEREKDHFPLKKTSE